jgi:rubrerythrin
MSKVEVAMSDKPSYLGLLNAIAVGELGGEAQFDAWAAVTTNDELRGVLRTVALREAEHARSFAKRIDELGYTVRDRPDADLPRRVAIAASTDLTDCEKLQRLGFDSSGEARPDVFTRFFDDATIDPVTGALMGRYIAEERDTGRRLRACHAELAACEPAPTPTMAATPVVDTSTGSGLDVGVLERLDRIECALEILLTSAAAKAAKGTKTAKTAKGTKR